MNKKMNRKLPQVLTILLAAPSIANASTILYQETFTVDTDSTAAQVGWSFHTGSSATDRSSQLKSSGNDIGVNADKDYFRAKGNAPTGSGTNFLLSTTEGGSFSYNNVGLVSAVVGQDARGSSSSVQSYMLAIRTSDGWFASDTSVSSGSAVGTTTLSVDLPSESDWKTLTFTSGSALSLGAVSGTQPSGNDTILEYGVYWEQASAAANWMKIDDFTVTAVPEPSSAALLGLGGLSLILRRRR